MEIIEIFEAIGITILIIAFVIALIITVIIRVHESKNENEIYKNMMKLIDAERYNEYQRKRILELKIKKMLKKKECK